MTTDNPADPFKKALAEATKVLAEDPELAISYSVDPPGMSGEGVRLPQVTRRMTRDEVLLARGTADSFALRRKYHDDATAIVVRRNEFCGSRVERMVHATT